MPERRLPPPWSVEETDARLQRPLPMSAPNANSDNADRAAKIIRDALGIESDDVVNYCFPKDWSADRERRARYIGEWLKTEARYLWPDK